VGAVPILPVDIGPIQYGKKIEELMNVKGIGEKSFLKLKPMITIAAKPDKPTAQR
jgi:hypothetical protein